MEAILSRSALPRPEPTAGCRHSSEAFDTAFAVVKHSSDLTLADRLVHAALVSLHRLGKLGEVTQQQIAEWACVSRRTVVRAIQALVAAGLLIARRWGQGRPNTYQLVGIDEKALAGRSDKRSQPVVAERRNPARARTFPPKRNDDGRIEYGTKDFTMTRYGPLPEACARCGTREHSTAWHV